MFQLKALARISLCMLLCLSSSLPFNAKVSSAANSTTAQHASNGATLRVALNRNSIDYFLYRSTPTGLQLELVQQFALHLGSSVEVVPVDSPQQGIYAVQNGLADFYATSDSLSAEKGNLLACSLRSAENSSYEAQHPIASWLFLADKSSLFAQASQWLKSNRCARLRNVLASKFGNQGYMRRILNNSPSSQIPLSAYDSLIKIAAANTRWDWRWIASIIYQESRFIPTLYSRRGAFGLMQMTPITAKHFNIPNLNTPEAQINAGVNYLHWLDSQFEKHGVPLALRNDFILAAYNAGYSRIRQAQLKAAALGLSPTVWVGNVAIAHAKLSPDAYRSNPLAARYGTGETCDFVRQINCRYIHYKNLV